MSNQFGINVKQYCREHEKKVAQTPPSPALLSDLLHEIAERQLEATREVGVAPRTAEVAAREAHEHAWSARVAPLSLKGLEYLSERVHR